MQIQINTGHNVDIDDQLRADVEDAVHDALDRFEDRITRVEVHLTDENAGKGGRDSRCVIEARVAGVPPVAVDETALSAREAVRGAAGKLERALETRFAKARER